MKTTVSSVPRRNPVATPSKSGSHPAHELIKRVQCGLRFKELETLRGHLGLTMEQMGEKLGFARATLHRRKIAGRLTPDESDKVNRFAHLFRIATQVLGDEERARLWLSFPQYGLGGVVPLNYAGTEVGAREVENLLGRIEYGVLA